MREREIIGSYKVILDSLKLFTWSGVEECLDLELAKKKFILDYNTKIKELISL